MRRILRLTALIASITACACGLAWSRPVQTINARLNGVKCIVELDPGAAQTVRVLSPGHKEIWRGIPKSLKPWKIMAADVDGDGRMDLGVGVYKKARFHPVMAKRPFVYTWDGKSFVPKWLGSRLSRPFTDFVFADFPGGPKLVSIEQTVNGENELAVYQWEGFGFTRQWTGCHAKSLSGLRASGCTVRVRSDKSDRVFAWNGKALKEVRS